MFSKKKRRFSSEYTLFSIVEYLFVNSQRTPLSKYNIVTYTQGIKTKGTNLSILGDVYYLSLQYLTRDILL
jgi:hypothetical protein